MAGGVAGGATSRSRPRRPPAMAIAPGEPGFQRGAAAAWATSTTATAIAPLAPAPVRAGRRRPSRGDHGRGMRPSPPRGGTPPGCSDGYKARSAGLGPNSSPSGGSPLVQLGPCTPGGFEPRVFDENARCPPPAALVRPAGSRLSRRAPPNASTRPLLYSHAASCATLTPCRRPSSSTSVRRRWSKLLPWPHRTAPQFPLRAGRIRIGTLRTR